MLHIDYKVLVVCVIFMLDLIYIAYTRGKAKGEKSVFEGAELVLAETDSDNATIEFIAIVYNENDSKAYKILSENSQIFSPDLF